MHEAVVLDRSYMGLVINFMMTGWAWYSQIVKIDSGSPYSLVIDSLRWGRDESLLQLASRGGRVKFFFFFWHKGVRLNLNKLCIMMALNYMF